MKFGFLLLLVLSLTLFPSGTLARVTPNDLYQAKRADFESNLSKISDSSKKETVRQADRILGETNQRVCQRFDVEIAHLAAILEEKKYRQGVSNTVVAYGRGNTALDSAAYYLNYAAEAVAYQKIQDYTPLIGQGNLKGSVNTSMLNLKSNLQTVQGKILKAKAEVGKAVESEK
ncbi:MAG: hypothetical protein Q7S44_03770 [bacterium]|nr:hypothetical protein [bacterium]